jgi:ubiquinone/menaquinone biosynthesis C-methylase UbiE
MNYSDSGLAENLSYRNSSEAIFEVNNTYDRTTAQLYFEKHSANVWRRLSNFWEQHRAQTALTIAGDPKSVLDLPCGTGRFWESLARMPDRFLVAADYSQDMINTALSSRPIHIAERFHVFRTSAFDIDLPDAMVDCVFSMRLLHHIKDREARSKILSEFRRVSRDTVCVSLWVDGNVHAIARHIKTRHRDTRDYTRYVFSPEEIEREFSQSGFDIRGHVDFVPAVSMWRTYVLKRR